MKTIDLVIIGGGSAGLAAAIKAHDLGVHDLLILEKNDHAGGILDQCIHNGFGLSEFKEELTGPEFMSRLINEAMARSIDIRLSTFVLSLDRNKVITYVNAKEGVVVIQAKAIILTTGCYERSAGGIALPGDRPAGIYTAGQAQLYLNTYGHLVGRRVFILGSGDIGLIMARRMTLEGAKVLGVAELMPYSAGLNRNIVQCLKDFDIPLYLSHTVKKVIGRERLRQVVIAPVDEHLRFIPGHDLTFDVDTLLLSVGLLPSVDLLEGLGLSFSKARGPLVNEWLETDLPGLFAAGNVLHVHDLVDDVVKEARQAGEGAVRYLHGQLQGGPVIDIIAGEGISYVVPAKIIVRDAGPEVILKFRVRSPLHDAFIFHELNGRMLKKTFKPAIIPSEMETAVLPRALFEEDETGRLVVSMKGKTR